jgi:putative transposase
MLWLQLHSNRGTQEMASFIPWGNQFYTIIRTQLDKESFAAKLKQIWQQPDYESAKRYAELLIEEYEARFPKAVEVLANGLEDSLQFYGFPEIDAKKISSTNMLERLHKEIRRRSKVVGIFPSMDSYIRLISCYLIEYAEDWETSKCYIRKEILQHILARRNAA